MGQSNGEHVLFGPAIERLDNAVVLEVSWVVRQRFVPCPCIYLVNLSPVYSLYRDPSTCVCRVDSVKSKPRPPKVLLLLSLDHYNNANAISESNIVRPAFQAGEGDGPQASSDEGVGQG